PGHLLLVPQHPEVTEGTGDSRDDAAQVAQKRRAPAEGTSVVEADDADAHGQLADGLAGGPAFHVPEVGEVDDEAEEAADRRAEDDSDDGVDDAEDDEVDQPGHEPEPEAR